MHRQYRPSPAAFPGNNTFWPQGTPHLPPLGPLHTRSFLSRSLWGLHTVSEGHTPTALHLVYNENSGQHLHETKIHFGQYARRTCNPGNSHGQAPCEAGPLTLLLHPECLSGAPKAPGAASVGAASLRRPLHLLGQSRLHERVYLH